MAGPRSRSAARSFLALLALLFTPASCLADGPPFFINLHPGDAHGDMGRARAMFHRIHALGARGVRTDVPWTDLEPAPGQWSVEREAWYRDFLAQARAEGLDVVAVLYGGCLLHRDWTYKLAHGDPERFLSAYADYATRAARLAGDSVREFQVWNEANGPIDAVADALEPRLFQRGAAAIHAVRADARVSINILTDAVCPHWARTLDRWLASARDSIDAVGIDTYPGTWSGGNGDRFGAIETAVDILARRDPAHRILLAVGETGYSTWGAALPPVLPVGHREADQAAWYARAIPALRRQLAMATLHSGITISYVNLYELVDFDTAAGPNPENHFGLLHSDLSDKPAAALLRGLLDQGTR